MDKISLLCHTNSYDDYRCSLIEPINLESDADYNVSVASCSYGAKFKQIRTITVDFDGYDKSTTIRFLDDPDPRTLVTNIAVAIHVGFHEQSRKQLIPYFEYSNGYISCQAVDYTVNNKLNGKYDDKRFKFVSSDNTFLSDIGFDIDGLNLFLETSKPKEKYHTYLPYELDPSALVLHADIAGAPLCVLPSSKDYIQFDGSYTVPIRKKVFDSISFTLTSATLSKIKLFRRIDLAVTLIITKQYKDPPKEPEGIDYNEQILMTLRNINATISESVPTVIVNTPPPVQLISEQSKSSAQQVKDQSTNVIKPTVAITKPERPTINVLSQPSPPKKKVEPSQPPQSTQIKSQPKISTYNPSDDE